MKFRNIYLLPFLVLLTACSGSGGEEKLYPTKMTIGGTTHEFLYNQGRIYSVTTARPNFYEEVTYRYYDEYFHKPEHRFKDKIFEIHTNPDNGLTGWDGSDSVKYTGTMLMRSETGVIEEEDQNVYLQNRNESHNIKHIYDAANRLSESIYYFADHTIWNEEEAKDPNWLIKRIRQTSVVTKRVKYEYAQGKLAKVGFYAPGAEKPYLLIELTYDDKPGYLSSLPLEARFMPLELPYRDHNIVSYKVKDIYGKVRKDLSYTCTYSYNKAGYPTEFTRKMGDGQEIEGHIYYRAAADSLTEMLSIN